MHIDNERIAKNTMYMYLRLITVMVIGLYTSRLVLNILGVSDFGLFSVVGGVLALFTFISSSLASATSRFLNIEMGKPDGDVNRTFNINVLLHCMLAAAIFLLAETIGLWYIYNKLNVADGKIGDAVFVYHISIVTACLGIMNSPFQSLFNAHEQFRFTSIFDIVNTLIRLGCILLLSLYEGKYALCIYSMIMGLTMVLSFIVYHAEAYRRWHDTVRFRLIRGWNNYKEVLVFGNWSLLATMSYMARSSGSDLLLNSFFGTHVNGAFAIGRSVNQYVSTFSCSFDGTSSPQIIQAYAAKDMGRVEYLVNKTGRFGLLIFIILFFPLNIELNYILSLWLGEVPEGTLPFVRLYLIVAGIAMSCGGINALLRAYGRIKWFQIELSFFFLICIPLGYYLFSIGFPPYYILILFGGADIMHRIVQLTLARVIIGFDSLSYIREAYLRPFIIASIMSIITFFIQQNKHDDNLSCLSIIVLTVVTAVFLTYTIGLTNYERGILKNDASVIISKIKARIRR